MNNSRRLLPALALTAAAGLALTSCGDGSSAATTTEDGRLKVAASFYPMEYLAEEIGGEHVAVSTLAKPGVEPHDLELSPRQTGELAGSGLIVYLKGFQPAVDEAIEQSGAEHVVDTASFTDLAKEDGHEGHEGHEGHGHEDDGHGHEEGAGDPHFWLDPTRYAQAAEGVGKALAEADPDHAAAYERNAADLSGRLGELDREFREGLKNTDTDVFMTTHAAFGYLADRYGLVQESIKGLDPQSEPSGARMRDLQEIAEHDRVSTVFFETLVSDKTAKTFAGDLGLRTDVLDPVEGITAESRGDDYIEIMHANLAALRKALNT